VLLLLDFGSFFSFFFDFAFLFLILYWFCSARFVLALAQSEILKDYFGERKAI
jgi:hypothetical protein